MKSIQFQAFVDLSRRYLDVWRAAWSQRSQMDGPNRRVQEVAFLPASLELTETPSHPAPRWLMRIILSMALVILIVTVFGKLDIVATAKGKLIPDARIKIIQPAMTGVVRKISVQDGDRVTQGQVLMELDTSQAAADSEKATIATSDMALTMARSQALLEAQQKNQPPKVTLVDGASPDAQLEVQHFADGLYREYEDKLSSAQAELAKRQGELQSTRAEIEKYQATAPLARQQADSYKRLAGESLVAQNDYLDKEQAAVNQEQELKAEQGHAAELTASITQQRAEVASITSQFRREQMDTLDRARQQFTQNRGDATKAESRQRLLTLTAPVAGTVQQLAVHTVGGVVTTAQSLMEIVPDDTVIVEATVENKDIGFVNVGQRAVVKLEAFPYTQYGYLTGTVESISNDAVQDKKLGLAFMTRVRLTTNKFRVNDKSVNLTPGMEVTADINTGKRSVMAYFLDPLIQTSQESLRER